MYKGKENVRVESEKELAALKNFHKLNTGYSLELKSNWAITVYPIKVCCDSSRNKGWTWVRI